MLLGSILLAAALVPARALSDSEIIKGFNETAFGSEIAPFGIQTHYIHRFEGPVRFYIHDLGKIRRKQKVARFIASLPVAVRGLKAGLASKESQANFHVYVVDRKDYSRIARGHILSRPFAKTPGSCYVRTIFTRRGNHHSDAIIVSDEGEKLFHRCMVEEILQGLGPLNENRTLSMSVFNDASKQTGFTKFDRYILNILYDRRLKSGDSKSHIAPLLPEIINDLRKHLH